MPISSPRRTLGARANAHQAMLKCPWQWRKPFLDAKRASRKRQMGDGLFYDPVDPTFIDHLLPFYSKKFGLGLEHDEKTQIEHEMRRLMLQRQQQVETSTEDEQQTQQCKPTNTAASTKHHGTNAPTCVLGPSSSATHHPRRHQLQQRQLVADAVAFAATNCQGHDQSPSVKTETSDNVEDCTRGSRIKRLCVESLRCHQDDELDASDADQLLDVSRSPLVCELVSDDLANCYFACDLLE